MVRMIANHFAGQGHDVHVIYSIRADTPAAIQTLFDRQVVLHHVQMTLGRAIVSTVTLRRLLTRLRPDVVHLHSSLAGFLGRIAAVAALPHATFVYSPHCISFMRQDLSFARRNLFIALERLASLRRCRYLACSESERRAIHTCLGQPVDIIENAIGPVAAFGPRGRRGTTARCEIVTVGGIRPQKDPMLFAAIARRAAPARLRFTWVGDGDAALRQVLIEAGVRVTGWIAPAAVAMHLADADIYLSTSAWEGMPVSILEAMSHALPVVATRCAGNVDVVDAPCTGVLFDDADAATAALGQLANDPAARARLGDAARVAVRTRFNDTRFFRQLQRFYDCRGSS
ncbi:MULTISPECIES: glycosyltransferase family 4 protein [Burkholderia]|uniref:glycosyltransferase family 4 protein n=1 Tax=Burkholderia TaxID=32008 RepID=UPI00359C48F9